MTAVLAQLAQRWPDAGCELRYRSPFELLVAVMLSAQSTDRSVNAVTAGLFAGGWTPQRAVQLGPEAILAQIRSVGLAPTKARNVWHTSQLLLERHQGQVPRTESELMALPGVGIKTAHVVLGELYGEPTLAVDTHVLRVSRRLGWHDESDPVRASAILHQVVPTDWRPRAHHILIFHGRYLCQARRPRCSTCPVRAYCEHGQQHSELG